MTPQQSNGVAHESEIFRLVKSDVDRLTDALLEVTASLAIASTRIEHLTESIATQSRAFDEREKTFISRLEALEVEMRDLKNTIQLARFIPKFLHMAMIIIVSMSFCVTLFFGTKAHKNFIKIFSDYYEVVEKAKGI